MLLKKKSNNNLGFEFNIFLKKKKKREKEIVVYYKDTVLKNYRKL
jgi:hypothetical protein